MFARVVAAVVAVVVLAWLGLMERDTSLMNSGVSLQHHAVSLASGVLKGNPGEDWRAEFVRAESQLRDSEFLNPDASPELGRARGYLFLGAAHLNRIAFDPFATTGSASDQARRIAESVVRREPQNLEAWETLYAANLDPTRSDQVMAQILRLDPLIR